MFQSCSEGYRVLPMQLLMGFAVGSACLGAHGKAAPMLVGTPALKCCRDKAGFVPFLTGWWSAAYV